MLRFTNIDYTPTRLPPIYGYRTHPLLPLRQALEPVLSQIDELDEFIQIAKSECHFPSEHGLTREESASIYIYTMDWGEQSLYRVLNNMLRTKDRSVLLPWYGYIKLLDSALKKLPTCHMSLWRGINVDISKNFKEGETRTWWTFSSCSSSVKVVQQFLGSTSTLLMIDAKNGKVISAYSNFPEENEVILGLGTRLRVMSDPLDHSSLNVVHLAELSDENDEKLSLSLDAISINQSAQTTARDWVDDKMKGEGIFTWSTGQRYDGQWNNDKKNGKGTIFFASGSKYTGDWVDDNRTGEGIFIWSTGQRYEGQWNNDKRNGKGKMWLANEVVKDGMWSNDTFIG